MMVSIDHEKCQGHANCIRFGPDVFAQLEVLEEAETVRLVILRRRAVLPDVPVLSAFRDVADGVFPTVHIVKIFAFDDATAGETNESGFQIGDLLNQVIS